MTNDCRKTRWMMEREMDGEARAGERDFLKSHTKACSRCRTLLEDNRRRLEQIASSPLPSAPEGFAERVISGLGRRERVRPLRRTALAAGLALAASVAILFGAWALLRVPGPSQNEGPPITRPPQATLASQDPMEAVELFAGCVNTGLSNWVLASGEFTGEVAASTAEGLNSLGSLFNPFGAVRAPASALPSGNHGNL